MATLPSTQFECSVARNDKTVIIDNSELKIAIGDTMQTARKLKPTVAPRVASRKRLRVVKTKSQLRMPDLSSMFSFLLVSATILAAILIFNVSQRALIAQSALQNKQLKDVLEKEQLKHEKLLLTKIILSSPDRIEKRAIEKLGMVNPVEVSYLELPEEIEKQGGAAVKSPSSLTPKDEAPWQIMTKRITGQIGVSSLEGIGVQLKTR
jgi:cell division protein FtsL